MPPAPGQPNWPFNSPKRNSPRFPGLLPTPHGVVHPDLDHCIVNLDYYLLCIPILLTAMYIFTYLHC